MSSEERRDKSSCGLYRGNVPIVRPRPERYSRRSGSCFDGGPQANENFYGGQHRPRRCSCHRLWSRIPPGSHMRVRGTETSRSPLRHRNRHRTSGPRRRIRRRDAWVRCAGTQHASSRGCSCLGWGISDTSGLVRSHPPCSGSSARPAQALGLTTDVELAPRGPNDGKVPDLIPWARDEHARRGQGRSRRSGARGHTRGQARRAPDRGMDEASRGRAWVAEAEPDRAGAQPQAVGQGPRNKDGHQVTASHRPHPGAAPRAGLRVSLRV